MSSGNNSDYDDSDNESTINENNLINELTHSDRYREIFNNLVQVKYLSRERSVSNITNESRASRENTARHIVAENLLENGWSEANRREKDAIILAEVGTALAYLEGMSMQTTPENSRDIQNYIGQMRGYITRYLNNNDDDNSDQASDLGSNQDFGSDFGSDSGSEPGTHRQPYNAQGGRKRKTKKSKKSKKSRKSKKSKKSRKTRKH